MENRYYSLPLDLLCCTGALSEWFACAPRELHIYTSLGRLSNCSDDRIMQPIGLAVSAFVLDIYATGLFLHLDLRWPVIIILPNRPFPICNSFRRNCNVSGLSGAINDNSPTLSLSPHGHQDILIYSRQSPNNLCQFQLFPCCMIS